MKDMYVTYNLNKDGYHIECKIDNEVVCGGRTDCFDYDDAYIFTLKIAKTKNARIVRFANGSL